MDVTNSDGKFRRQSVSIDQMNILLEFLQEHQELAKGHNRGRRGKVHSVKLWNLCAKKLNPLNDGAMKNGKGWSKYWCDWKYRVRRKALELIASKGRDKPIPEGLQPLTEMEERILGLIGGNAVNGVVIKTDPLAEDFEEADVIDNRNNDEDSSSTHESVIVTQCTETQSTSHKRKQKLYSNYSSGREEAASTCKTSKRSVQSARNGNIEQPDYNNETAEFLRLERANLENSKKILDSVQSMASQITRLVDVMSQIRDIIAGSSTS